MYPKRKNIAVRSGTIQDSYNLIIEESARIDFSMVLFPRLFLKHKALIISEKVDFFEAMNTLFQCFIPLNMLLCR